MTRVRRTVWIQAGWIVLAAAIAGAQQHPNDATGFSPEKTYEVNDVDTINLFNGNVSVHIPIGMSYPVGPGLSFSLALTYASAPWDFEGLPHPQVPTEELTQAFVRPTNAGLGWDLNPGRIRVLRAGAPGNSPSPVYRTYESPDGGVHRFYQSLHPDGLPFAAGNVGFTRDGTFLKLTVVGSGHHLRFPDGSVHEFDAQGRLIRIRGRDDANFIKFCYQAADDCSIDFNGWLITDSHFRRHEVHFANGVVDRVKLERFGVSGLPPQAGDARFAIYELGYAHDVVINRPCPANYDNTATPNEDERVVAVDLLTSVRQPDGSYWLPGAREPGTQGALAYETQHPWNAGGTCPNGGLMLALRLPTRGRIEWTYQQYRFPNDTKRSYYNRSPGVQTRKLIDRDGVLLGEWTYETQLNRVTTTDPEEAEEIVTTVRSPLLTDAVAAPDQVKQFETKHYFTTYPLSVERNGWKPSDYGLPFTRRASATCGTRLLSREVFERLPSGLVLRRTTCVAYGRDSGGMIVLGLNQREDLSNVNRRLEANRTVYHDAGSSDREVSYSGWDQFGHFETETVSGSFPSAAARTTFMDYDADEANWFLDRLVKRTVTENSETFTELYCVQDTDSPGFRTRRRVLASTAADGPAGPTDIIVKYTPNDRGEVKQEDYYGGDGASLDTTALCGMPLPANSTYSRDNVYQNGVLKTSQLLGAPSNEGFAEVNRVIDRSGLVASSKDSTGQLVTNYQYTEMGRVRMVQAPGSAWTEIGYLTGWSSGEPTVTVRQKPNGQPDGEALTERQWIFDGFGRIREERERREGGLDRTLTNYDPVGNVTFKSERGGAGSFGTSFSRFDGFGRAREIRAADCPAAQSQCATKVEYVGEQQVKRTQWVGTSENAAQTAVSSTAQTSIESYDHMGRLVKVEEPIGTAATYVYDGADRLRKVTQTATGAVPQVREFGYDGRGFLRWENHPEKISNLFTPPGAPVGYPAASDVDYTGYDPFGNVGTVADGDVQRRYEYDTIGRPKKVFLLQMFEQDHLTRQFSPPRILQEYGYGTGTGAADRSRGKQSMVRRYNYAWNGNAEFVAYVTTDSTYGGLEGRVSARATTVNSGQLGSAAPVTERFDQGWTWNQMGLVETISYPRCAHQACAGAQGTTFADVPAGHPYKRDIEAIYDAGLTSGCAVGSYCPDGLLSRAEMAIFLLRGAKGSLYQPPACGPQVFNDVPCNHPTAPDHWAAKWINDFYRQGYTNGCDENPRRFCPSATVTRQEMAAFLLRIAHGPGYTPPSCSSSPFTDVSCSSTLGPSVVQAFNEGLISACGGGRFCPGDAPTRAQMARILVEGFDIPVLGTSVADSGRTVYQRYQDGALSEIARYASLVYHPNGLTRRVQLGAIDAWNQDITNGMSRPAVIRADSGVQLDYSYDPAGNVVKINQGTYVYDGASRLVTGRAGHGPYQQYQYDGFGNIKAVVGGNGAPGRNTPTDPTTNRLSESAVYSRAGELIWRFGVKYDYDGFHQMARVRNSGQDWQFLYDGYGERIASVRLVAGLDRFDRWTLRDLDGKVLRAWEATSYQWGRPKHDYIYRGGQLVATEWPADGRSVQFHLVDHLGTPRVSGMRTSNYTEHHYFAFGEETQTTTDGEALRFTGHERDGFANFDPDDDLDHMHARTYSPLWGRFLSFDRGAYRPEAPQSWNRYAYANNNPLRYVDPTGRDAEEAAFLAAEGTLALSHALHLETAALGPIGILFTMFHALWEGVDYAGEEMAKEPGALARKLEGQAMDLEKDAEKLSRANVADQWLHDRLGEGQTVIMGWTQGPTSKADLRAIIAARADAIAELRRRAAEKRRQAAQAATTDQARPRAESH